MRETYSLPKLVTFSNDECLTTQVSVYSADIPANAKGKKIIKSGDLLIKSNDGKVTIAKRRKPLTNNTNPTYGVVNLNDVDNIAVGDKLDFMFPGVICTFATGTGNRTLTIGDLSFTFGMGATGDIAASNLIDVYNALVPNTRRGIDHNLVLVASDKVLIQTKTKAAEAITITPSTSITTVAFSGVNGDIHLEGTLGTVTAIDTDAKYVTYTPEAAFIDLNLGDLPIRFKAPTVYEDAILGICIQDYDLTGIDTRMIPLLTSSNGCYKARLTYFDQDLVNLFPKIEFI